MSAALLTSLLLTAGAPQNAWGQGRGSGSSSAQVRGAELFNKGAEAYRRGEFQQAVTLLLEAYTLDPQPVLLYNLARAYEGLGNIDASIDTFTRYLEADPKTPDRGAIEQRLVTLRRQRDERVALEKQRDAERARADQEKAERERRAAMPKEPPPHKRSVGPYVVAGAGVVGLATGVVVGLMATAKHDNAEALTMSQLESIEQQDKAKSLATVSTVAFVVGGALVAGGVTWWVLDGRTPPKQGVSAKRPLRVGLLPGFLVLEGGLP